MGKSPKPRPPPGGDPPPEIRVGISSCLLGEEVRFDGGHKRDRFLTDTLARFVTFVPVCPEVELGLGTPREAIHLREGADGAVRLVGVRSGADHTKAMTDLAGRRTRELAALDLSGYVFKKDSPSCGLHRVRLYRDGAPPGRGGRGLFAAALTERIPLLPVEEEGRLNDPALRENFVERVFAYRRLRSFFATGWRPGGLVRFHTAEKMLVLAHDPAAYRTLGRLVAEGAARPRAAVAQDYQRAFMAALGRAATPRKHANVLQHMAGHFKTFLGPADKAELQEAIEDFRAGLVPLVVPLTLIRHYVRLFDVAYLAGQTYLSPHPKELMLRNHA